MLSLSFRRCIVFYFLRTVRVSIIVCFRFFLVVVVVVFVVVGSIRTNHVLSRIDGGENPAPVDSRAMNLMKVLIGND